MIAQAAQDTLTKSSADVSLPLWSELSLADPYFLVVIPIALIAAALGVARLRHAPGRVPFVPRDLPRSLRQNLLWIPSTLRVAAVVLTILALARPLRGDIELSSLSEGVDIVLLLDRSSSMEQKDVRGRDVPRRFDIASRVLADFATRRMNDSEGASDYVALVGFARYPELLCPFTLDSDAMTGILAEVDTEKRKVMDGTGIGIAIAKAVAVLENSEAKSRVVILLTDGEETVNIIPPMRAARIAAAKGIKVYTVYAGPRFRKMLTLNPGRPSYDKPVHVGDLPEIAELTGAKFYHAETAEELEQVYAEIEGLERTEREQKSYAEHFDLYPRLLVPAFVLYLLSWLSALTWARRIP